MYISAFEESIKSDIIKAEEDRDLFRRIDLNISQNITDDIKKDHLLSLLSLHLMLELQYAGKNNCSVFVLIKRMWPEILDKQLIRHIFTQQHFQPGCLIQSTGSSLLIAVS